MSDLETLTQDDTHLLIFRDDALMVQNFSANRMDIEGINLEPAILQDPTENLLEDASTIISQVTTLFHFFPTQSPFTHLMETSKLKKNNKQNNE